MTIDKEEIKAISLACDPFKCADEAEEDRRLAEFYSELTPETVLALLEEIEQLHDSHEQVCANYNRVSFASEERGKQVDQLKAEKGLVEEARDLYAADKKRLAFALNDARAEAEALRKDAERYRFVRNPIGTSSPLAIWSEGKMPLYSSIADAVVDELMAKEAFHD